jgi:hypothetical protein
MKKIALVFLFLSVTAGGAETGKKVSAKPLSAPVMDARVVNGQKACNPETVCSSMDDRIGPPILNHAPAPQVEVAQLAGTPPMIPQRAATPVPVVSSGGSRPRYDVTSSPFGALGNGKADDTDAIQAAFASCGNTFNNPPANTQQNSGVVEFPGGRNYLVSRTINTYNCQIEGATGNIQGSYSPPRILWNGPSAGVAAQITGFSITSNRVAFTAANSLSAGQFVEIEGLSAGFYLNRAILQVSSTGLSATRFEATLPFGWADVSATADSGAATTVNVFFALPSNARYQQSISNISLGNKSPKQANTYDVGFYFGSRVDTGTHVTNTWVAGANKYGYYFSSGGINVDFDKGWRSDSAGVAGIYWRIAGSDSFGVANGTVDNGRSAYGSPSSGAAVMLDNAACVANLNVHFTSRNVKVEVNTTLTPGLGVFTLYDCPSNANGEQFFLDFESTWVSPGSQSRTPNFPSFVMSPANDKALNLSVLNSQFPNGTPGNATTRWVGLPELLRHDILGASGFIPLLSYAPSLNSGGEQLAASRSPIQLLGDVNISQLWQYGIPASDFLYSDTGFAVLPNATTLFAGQILAPPAYWSGVNGKRFALDVVYQTGTTGTPNGGSTACSGTMHTTVLTCTSATDLSAGQRITIGTDANKTINFVDATNPSAVRVMLTSNLGASYSQQTLTFSAPLLAPEMQMPTKSPGAPTSLTWAQGDTEQNSAAAANGVAAWVNVASGAPGSWAGIPLGDSSGKIAASQLASSSTVGSGSVVLANQPTVNGLTGTGATTLTDLMIKGRCIGCAGAGVRTAQAFCAGTASSSSTILLFGAGSSQTACTQAPGPHTLQQVIAATGGVLSNLAVRCGHLGSQPASGRFTVWDLPSGTAMLNASSGTNTGLAVTIGNSAANANKTILDTTHTFAYAAGDMLRIQFTTEANEMLGDCTASFNY